MKIKISNPDNLPLITIASVKPLQGNLKDLSEKNYNKLKNSILKHGFIDSIAIWNHDAEFYMIDGHQRQRVFQKEGWTQSVPARIVEADTLEDAKEKLLKISSQYGTITQEGFDEFTAELPELALEDINFDALKFGNEKDMENKEINPEDLLSENVEQCPRCKFEFECKNVPL